MKVLSKISLVILILFSSTNLFAENKDFNNLLEARRDAFLSQPQFKDLSDEHKHLLGGCWSNDYRKCMTQTCCYCVGQGSCENCDDPTNCSSCPGGCELSGSDGMQQDCADACAILAGKDFWF